MQVAGLQTQTDQSPQSKTLISAGWQANTVQSLKGCLPILLRKKLNGIETTQRRISKRPQL